MKHHPPLGSWLQRMFLSGVGGGKADLDLGRRGIRGIFQVLEAQNSCIWMEKESWVPSVWNSAFAGLRKHGDLFGTRPDWAGPSGWEVFGDFDSVRTLEWMWGR